MLTSVSIGLKVFKCDADNNYSSRKSFRFAVVDFRKSQVYPSNFVCMLPTRLETVKADSVFVKVFGEKSLMQAKALLKEAFENEDDSEVKEEIKRRLKLLEPKQINQVKCSGCGKLFQSIRKRRFKSNFCEECRKKKFGNRT